MTQVTANGSDMTITFADPDAGKNRTGSYSVLIDSKKIFAGVNVQFEKFTLTPDIPYVLSNATDVKVSFTLNGEFEAGLTENDISLYGSFADMEIQSLSAAGSNLTMQLKVKDGKKIEKDAGANAYVDGVVYVAPDAIKGAHDAVAAKIPVETVSAYFVGEELAGSGTSYSVPLVLIDCGKEISTLTKNDIKFYEVTGYATTDGENEGTTGATTAEYGNITVNSVAPSATDGTRVTLSLNIAGATDCNSAADILNGKIVKTGDFEFVANVADASFYPVFDYVEKAGDNLAFTLDLYAHSGTFKREIAPSDVALSDGFAGATDIKISNVSDGVAELTFKIPANEQTTENLSIDGTVTLNAGALVNMWDQASGKSASYTRSYAQESMGRFSVLGRKDLGRIQQIVGGFGNTYMGTLSSLASGGASAASAILTILDLTGIMPDKGSQTLTLLKEVSETINSIQNLLNRQMSLMHDVQRQVYNSDLSAFDTQLANLDALNRMVSNFVAKAAEEHLGGVTLPEGLPKKADGSIDYDKDKLTDEQGAQMQDYVARLVQAIKEAESSDYGGGKYRGFTAHFEELENTFRSVCIQVTKMNEQNPMAVFDKLCTFTYNFSTSAYGIRCAQRLNISKTLASAMQNITIYYGCNAGNAVYDSSKKYYEKFLSLINTDTSGGKTTGAFAVLEAPLIRRNRSSFMYIMGVNVLLDDYVRYQKADGSWWKWNNVRYDSYCHESAFSIIQKNFADDEIEEFIYRMDGRTLKEELELAGFAGKFNTVGMAFKEYSRNDGKYCWYTCRHDKNYYADVIRYNGKTLERGIKVYNDDHTTTSGHLYCFPGQWYIL